MKVLLSIAFAIMVSVTAVAQEDDKPSGFEFSSSVSVATSKLSETTLNTGLGFEGIFHYRLSVSIVRHPLKSD